MRLLILFFTLLSINSAVAQPTTEQNLAIQYYNNEEYAKAVELFEKLYEKNTSSSQLYRYYYNTLLKLKEYGKSEKILKKNIKNYPQDLYYIVDLGNVYKQKGDSKTAEAEYNKVFKLFIPSEMQITQTASAFMNYNELTYAIKTYEAGQQVLRNPYAFAFDLAALYESTGANDKAINQYLNYVIANPSQAQLIQNKVQEPLLNNSFFNLFKDELLSRLQSNSAPMVYYDLLIWAFIQRKDFRSAYVQTKALDKRLNENGSRVINLARSAVAEKQYDAAIEAFEYVMQKGKSNPNYLTARQELLQVRKSKITESNNYTKQDIITLNNEYSDYVKEFGINRNTAAILLEQAKLQALYLYNLDSAITIAEFLVNTPQLDKAFRGNAKLDLGDYYVMQGDVYEPVLLYTQVEKDFKDQPLAELARFKNAKLSYFKGDFEWAQAQLTILKSATSELVANDALELSVFIQDNLGLDTTTYPMELYAKADLLYYQNKLAEAVTTLDSVIDILPNHALADDILFFKARIAKANKQDSLAANYLEKIIALFKEDLKADDATFMLAELYETTLNDKAKAQQLYEDIIVKFKDSIFATEARKRYRKLRGDAL
jgi:tetratricopeptide (TPR) repeat protein